MNEKLSKVLESIQYNLEVAIHNDEVEAILNEENIKNLYNLSKAEVEIILDQINFRA